MSVDSIDAEPEEDEENEQLIDSDDEGGDDENSPGSDDSTRWLTDAVARRGFVWHGYRYFFSLRFWTEYTTGNT